MSLPNYVISLENWVGMVDDILGDRFIATCSNLNEEQADSQIEFGINELPPDKQKLLEVGTVFHWHLDEVTDTDGETVDKTNFCIVPEKPWTKAEIEEVKRLGEQAARAFRDELGA